MAIDTRLQSGLLLDPKLQRRLSPDEFKSFINLLVYAVSLVSDGVFDPADAEMVIDPEHLPALVQHGLVNRCEDTDLHRIAPAYWTWQTSKAQLEGAKAKREADAARKRSARQRQEPPPPDEPPPPFDYEPPWQERPNG